MFINQMLLVSFISYVKIKKKVCRQFGIKAKRFKKGQPAVPAQPTR